VLTGAAACEFFYTKKATRRLRVVGLTKKTYSLVMGWLKINLNVINCINNGI